MKKGDWYFIDGDRIALIVEKDKIFVKYIDIRRNYIKDDITVIDVLEGNYSKAHSVDIKNNRYSFFDEYNHYIGEVEI